MQKSIITVVGKNRVGIIAGVCNYLASVNVNVLDISQTIVSGFFNMMMIVDITLATRDFLTISNDFEKLGSEMGVIIKIQKEEIFNQMQRI